MVWYGLAGRFSQARSPYRPYAQESGAFGWAPAARTRRRPRLPCGRRAGRRAAGWRPGSRGRRWPAGYAGRSGYILAPPSEVDGKPYRLIRKLGGHGSLDWAEVTRLLEPQRHQQPSVQGRAQGRALGQLARWVASQPEGNRNSGLYWAANRALDADPAADLSPLAAAARQAGLAEPEITRTLDSARKTSHQAEAVT